MVRNVDKPNGKYCSKCRKSPAYDYNDIVKGRYCPTHYFLILLGSAALIGIVLLGLGIWG